MHVSQLSKQGLQFVFSMKNFPIQTSHFLFVCRKKPVLHSKHSEKDKQDLHLLSHCSHLLFSKKKPFRQDRQLFYNSPLQVRHEL